MIYKKLLDFQKLGISIKKNSINPHFKNEYADLNEVLDKVKKPLNDMNVVIIQEPELNRIIAHTETGSRSINETPGLRTRLIDTEDDTEVNGFVPFVGATDMQKLGGAITYAKRYALIAMLALEDDDDDGNKASAKPKKVSDDDDVPF